MWYSNLDMIYPEVFMTELTALQKNFADFCGNVRYNEPMSGHTSFRIGGPVEVMIFPESAKQLSDALRLCGKLGVKPAILGAGTNVLAPDEGMQGVVICLKDVLSGMELVDDTHIRVMAGVTMTRAAVFAANQGLSGLEFAHGIPGTVGGGVYMNAGAYGGEIKDVAESVEIMDFCGNIQVLSGEEMQFSYRHSILEDTGHIVLSAKFRLQKADPEDVKAKMRELQTKRSASQPLDLPSAGSAFKRPVGGYAAALIDQSGLKGYQVGGAAISTKHAGFAVNVGGATAQNVRDLLRQVSDIVYEKQGIRLEPEVRIW